MSVELKAKGAKACLLVLSPWRCSTDIKIKVKMMEKKTQIHTVLCVSVYIFHDRRMIPLILFVMIVYYTQYIVHHHPTNKLLICIPLIPSWIQQTSNQKKKEATMENLDLFAVRLFKKHKANVKTSSSSIVFSHIFVFYLKFDFIFVFLVLFFFSARIAIP